MHYLRRRARPPTPSPSVARDNAATAALARQWCAEDPDARTREVVQGWVARGETETLEQRLAPAARLRFGTAGLRAEMGAGYDRMNVLTVVGATEAVLAVLEREKGGLLRKKGVAVGFDARHNSRAYAVAVAGVFVAAGVPVTLFSRPVPTPLVAFAVVRGEGRAGGIVITASHNPAKDNGYKLFWADGSQIRPHIAAKIEASMKRGSKQGAQLDLDEAALRLSPLVSDGIEECTAEYMKTAVRKLRWSEYNAESSPVVYTAMHGVGYPYVSRVFEEFGLPAVIPVDSQTLVPDPDFSTVKKPNPEEKGALDLAIAKARECGARTVLANDPDADRLGCACVDPDSGVTRILTGDEIAALFADFLLLRFPEERQSLAMVASTVSSKFLMSMARKEGFTAKETLTGFKWLSKGAADLAEDGFTVLLAYEEAIGYMLRDGVRDKDGVSAAAVFAELAGYWTAKGITIPERLAYLSELYGYHLGHNGYLSLTEHSTPLAEIFATARADGFPGSLGSCTVVSVRDLTMGTDTAQPNNKALLPKDGNTQFITFACRSELLSDPSALSDVVISLRGSGTEPKVKFYSEIVVSSQADIDSGRAATVLKAAVDSAIAEILKPFDNKLEA